MGIEIMTGDITTLNVDTIVNAANGSLMGGGGVDGAIHRAGGPAILAACREIRRDHWPDGLPTGEAVITTAGNLPARRVIHTVGPIFHSDPDPHENLRRCYRHCLDLARREGLSSIAFPGISTGVYGFPKLDAARIAIDEIHAFRERHDDAPARVILVAFSTGDADILQRAVAGS